MKTVNPPNKLRWRIVNDQLAMLFVRLGGVSIILAVVLICFFLVYVVAPLFGSASMSQRANYQLGLNNIRYLSTDEYQDKAVALTDDGVINVFAAQNGERKGTFELPIDSVIHSHDLIDKSQQSLFLGLESGKLFAMRIQYAVSYPNDIRRIDVNLEYPYGENVLDTALAQEAIDVLAVRDSPERLLVATWQQKGGLHLLEYEQTTSLLNETTTLSLLRTQEIQHAFTNVTWMGIDSLYNWLYVVDKNDIHFFDIRNLNAIHHVQTISFQQYGNITYTSFLLGNVSVLAGFDSGKVVQLFPVREGANSNNFHLQLVREFPAMKGAVSTIATEYSRRGFLVADAEGYIGLYYSTNSQQLLLADTGQKTSVGNFAPRENGILVASQNGHVQLFTVDNSYPEVSFGSLWTSLWYESYDEPDFIWQSSSSSNDFEPKFSLSPLTFGTIKAAFYAMLVATPLAIMAAIYTAFFLSPLLRQWIKPVVEVMEALPTVILGFLAGLWLAPFMEKNLLFIFTLLLTVPFCIPLFGYVTSRTLSNSATLWAKSISEEWRVVVLLPLMLFIGVIAWLLQPYLESAFFGGDMRSWISNDLGIDFDQRNALVVGVIMGFAVIPTIFSITEDAVFAVPKHLVTGSLALGASNWQTLIGVVLPTASPGIFSAVMIGMGRAVGETMIVLMATGNTAVMDFNIFEGMRTLSANIAVEMPESEVGSSHYRILFLAGLVLFIITFFFNTVGELVRQRLRKRYGSL